MKLSWITIMLFGLLLAGPAVMAVDGGVDTDMALFEQARAHDEAGEHQQAVDLLEGLLASEPQNAVYHYWLGRNYGRLAEQAPWYRAMGLANRTREAFERAVELDGDYVPALEALIRYYREAPGIVGGSEEKADKLQTHLESLLAVDSDRQPPPHDEQADATATGGQAGYR